MLVRSTRVALGFFHSLFFWGLPAGFALCGVAPGVFCSCRSGVTEHLPPAPANHSTLNKSLRIAKKKNPTGCKQPLGEMQHLRAVPAPPWAQGDTSGGNSGKAVTSPSVAGPALLLHHLTRPCRSASFLVCFCFVFFFYWRLETKLILVL